jgi:hypothetical protein
MSTRTAQQITDDFGVMRELDIAAYNIYKTGGYASGFISNLLAETLQKVTPAERERVLAKIRNETQILKQSKPYR